MRMAAMSCLGAAIIALAMAPAAARAQSGHALLGGITGGLLGGVIAGAIIANSRPAMAGQRRVVRARPPREKRYAAVPGSAGPGGRLAVIDVSADPFSRSGMQTIPVSAKQ